MGDCHWRVSTAGHVVDDQFGLDHYNERLTVVAPCDAEIFYGLLPAGRHLLSKRREPFLATAIQKARTTSRPPPVTPRYGEKYSEPSRSSSVNVRFERHIVVDRHGLSFNLVVGFGWAINSVQRLEARHDFSVSL